MIRKALSSNLLSDSAAYLLSNIISAVISFALIPILTRYLTPDEYGQVAIFQTLLVALGVFVGLNSQGAAGVKYYDAHLSTQELKYYIGNCFLVLVMTTALVLLCAVVFGNKFSDWLTLDIEWIILSIFVSAASFIVALRMGQWQVRKQAKKFGTFQIAQSLFNMLFSLLLVIHFVQGAAGRIWVLSAIPFAFSWIALFLLYKDGLLGFSWRPLFLREILAFSVPLMPHSAGLFLLATVDRFVISAELGLAQVGIYMLAVQLVSVMGLVFDAINNAYVPWLFERLKRDSFAEKQQIVRWTYGYSLVSLGVVALVFVIGPPLLELIAGEKYRPAGDVVGWLALGQAFNGMYLMVTNYIFYSKRTGLLSVATITSGLINVGLLLLLIGAMGIKGAAVAFAISMALKFLLTWFVSNLRHPMPWFDLRTIR